MVQLDVCSDASVEAAMASVQSKHGQLFGLINNAGGWLSTPRATIDLNTMAVIKVCEAFLPLIEKHGGAEFFGSGQSFLLCYLQEELSKFPHQQGQAL